MFRQLTISTKMLLEMLKPGERHYRVVAEGLPDDTVISSASIVRIGAGDEADGIRLLLRTTEFDAMHGPGVYEPKGPVRTMTPRLENIGDCECGKG